MKIIFNYRAQTQRCNSRLDLFESQLRASTSTASNTGHEGQHEVVLLLIRKETRGYFAAYYARSIDKLSGCITGRLGYDRSDSAYAIGGSAELALRYSN